MFGLGTTEVVIIGAVVLLFFGGKKLPELGKGLAKGLRGFQDGLKDNSEKTDDKLSS